MSDLAVTLVSRARAAGAAQAEALIKTGATRAVGLDAAGRVTWTRTAEGGVALRAFMADGAMGFASACGPDEDGPRAGSLVRAAIEAARSPGPRLTLPSCDPSDGRGLGIYDPRLNAATPADLEGMLDTAATEALRADPRVRRLDSAALSASSSEVWIRNSEGLSGSYRQTLVRLSLGVVAGDTGASVVLKRSRTARTLSAFSPALFGDETARLAAAVLEGRPPAEGTFPALLAPPAAAEALRLFARCLTPPGPGPGAEVGSRLLTIIDDGALPGGIASAPFDGEGIATRRTRVVSRGRFEDMIHDLASAARFGASSTGNGGRVSFRDPPRRSTSNLFIAPGSDSPEDMLDGLRPGIWAQTLRPTPAVINDEASFAAIAMGFWVEDGRPVAPVTGALLTCRLPDLLRGIVGLGNDLTFGLSSGSFGAPSLLVSALTVRSPWS